jgi:hypothetical protein
MPGFGVSTQLVGVEGGPIIVAVPGEAADLQGKGLKNLDPERYGSLEHPGDGHSFDIYTQMARAIRDAGPATGGVAPERVIAVGESQSALALTTYYNGVQPLTQAFDGFLVHSRAAASVPLVGPGEYADLAGGIGLESTTFCIDLETPVLDTRPRATSRARWTRSRCDSRTPTCSACGRSLDRRTRTPTSSARSRLVGPRIDQIDRGVADADRSG